MDTILRQIYRSRYDFIAKNNCKPTKLRISADYWEQLEKELIYIWPLLAQPTKIMDMVIEVLPFHPFYSIL